MKKYSKRNGCVFPPDKTFVTRQGMSLRRWMGRWIGTSTACSKTSQTAAVRSGFFHVHQNEKRSHKRLGVPASITPLHNAGHCSVKRMVPATPRRCFQKTDLDTFSFGVSDFLRESTVSKSLLMVFRAIKRPHAWLDGWDRLDECLIQCWDSRSKSVY